VLAIMAAPMGVDSITNPRGHDSLTSPVTNLSRPQDSLNM